MKTVGFGQGAWIGNFGEDGVRASGNIFSFGRSKRNGRFWAGPGLGTLMRMASRQKETFFIWNTSNDKFWAGRPDWELW